MANTKSTLSVAIGTAFVASLAAAPATQAAGNPFAMQSLSAGYMVADMGKGMDGKCGNMKKTTEAKCGGMKKADDGKCGTGKCGAAMMKDGKMSKADFMKAHEDMFDAMDTNHDGVVDASEMKAGMDCKCGTGKCGAMKK
jgi:uncharacterized low-complexity protein